MKYYFFLWLKLEKRKGERERRANTRSHGIAFYFVEYSAK